MVSYTQQDVWFNKPLLGPNEEVLLEIRANHTQGKRAVGGKIFVSDARLMFIPNCVDARTGGTTLEIPLGTITSVIQVRPAFRLTEIFSGGWLSRMGICTKTNETHLFIVNRLKRTLEIFKKLR